MTDPKSQQTDRQALDDDEPAPRPTNPREIPIFAVGSGREIWREIVGTERDKDPCGRFAYVAEKLIAEDRMRDRTLQVMREIRGRCHEKDGRWRYRIDPRAEIDPRAMVEASKHVDGVGTFTVASKRELVPRPEWMSREQWTRAFRHYVETMTGEDDRSVRRRGHLATMFGHVPMPQLGEFFLPARGVLTGHLVHTPLMGDLAELLAVVAAFAARNYQDSFDRAADYAMQAAKTPPIIAMKEDGGFHLIHVCRD